MCQVSDKIKFCTCSEKASELLKHYWIFSRFIKGRDVLVVGLPIFPIDINEDLSSLNKSILLKRINEADAFDVPLNQKSKDRLQIHIQFKNYYENFGFEFKKGVWVEKNFDAFEWMKRHEEEIFGKVKSIFKKR